MDRRALLGAARQHAEADKLHERRESDSRRQRKAGASERQHETPAEGGKVKPLEDRLEHEPLAHETGGWRHRGKTHGREQRANPEQPMAAGAGIGDDDSRRSPF